MQFGRLATAVPPSAIDKWEALSALTTAQESFGLNHRTLTVLRALMTFLPDRMITATPLSAVVFPSNATLSTRLNGMPESTLRRHIATLVRLGFVSRHNSANRKRFARSIGAGQRIAFGFDLSPLARTAQTLRDSAAAAKEYANRLAALRAEIAALRQQIIDTAGPCAETDQAHRILRRKPDLKSLETLLLTLSKYRSATAKTSTTNDHFERHIDTEKRSYSEQAPDTDTSALLRLVSRCNEYKLYAPNPPRHWEDLLRTADTRNPSAYMQTLITQARQGTFNIERLAPA